MLSYNLLQRSQFAVGGIQHFIANLAEARCLAFSGTLVLKGSATCVVYATGDRTFLGPIQAKRLTGRIGVGKAFFSISPGRADCKHYAEWSTKILLGNPNSAFCLELTVGSCRFDSDSCTI